MTAHTDHPARHWDRTCPACIADRAGLVAVLLFGAAWILVVSQFELPPQAAGA